MSLKKNFLVHFKNLSDSSDCKSVIRVQKVPNDKNKKERRNLGILATDQVLKAAFRVQTVINDKNKKSQRIIFPE